MRAKATQYGYASDPYGDSLTEAGFGAWNNKLTLNACALTDSLAKALHLKPLDWVKIDFGNGTAMSRQYQDKAPEQDLRCDCYEPHGFVVNRPDYAEVTKLVTTD